MNYQIRTVLQVQGGVGPGIVSQPSVVPLYGVDPLSPAGGLVLRGDVILSCQDITTGGGGAAVFAVEIMANGQFIQVNPADLSANTYLLLIGTPTQ